MSARRPLGAIPLIVLQADTDCSPKEHKPNAEGQAFDAQRCAELLSQARDSTRGERRIVVGASHMINHDKPEVVLEAFDEVVQAARSSGLATAEPD